MALPAALLGPNLGSTLSGVASVLGGLFGVFGKKPKEKTPSDNLLSQAQGAREAAEKYGFNPLTMLQYGQTGAMAGGGGAAPPLASIELLTQGLKDINDVVSGDAARRRQVEQFNLDLAKVKLDQARSGVAIVPRSNTGSFDDPSPLGRRAAMVTQNGAGEVYAAPARYRGIASRGLPFESSDPDDRVLLYGSRRGLDVGTHDDTRGLYIDGRFWEEVPQTTPPADVEDFMGDSLASEAYAAWYAARFGAHNLGRFQREADAAHQVEAVKRLGPDFDPVKAGLEPVTRGQAAVARVDGRRVEHWNGRYYAAPPDVLPPPAGPEFDPIAAGYHEVTGSRARIAEAQGWSVRRWNGKFYTRRPDAR